MANSSWIVPAAVAVIVPLVMSVVGRKNSAKAEAHDGWVEMKLPKFFSVLGWIVVPMAAGFAYGTISILMEEDLVAVGICGVAAVLFAWMAFILIRDGRYHRVAYTGTQFRVTDGNRRTQECAWSEVISGKVHPLSKMIHLKTKDGRVLKINGYLVGSDAFFAAMAERTSLPVADLVKQARYPG